ncbi:GTPase HflX [Bryobacter aggregatus]|uniref:GTPase HflX n=1 Tax=Bryobacter aggregatus TaxID=360054 RepID=UPI00068EA278|nr:GTPase HflX [Bryobacter aggregatus]
MSEIVILAGAHLRKQKDSSNPLTELSVEESLNELHALAESAGAQVAGRLTQTREQADRTTLIGAGKVAELLAFAEGVNAHTVIFDGELTPTQQRNLERELGRKVVDRTQLILDLFAARARTREGKLQVELAQLNYLMPRLAGRGVMMTRQGGGIGTRGPGETQLESDRRKINGRIKNIKQDLSKVRSGRGIQRKQRQSVPLETVALVGYTNAGKSTLFNRLTNAAVLADAKMFATLDPTVRHIVLPSKRKILLSDTVGFIRRLPTTLVESFRATLEEVVEAKLLLHVVDASSPHATSYVEHVHHVLKEIGAEGTRQILVLNKADLVKDASEQVAQGRRVLQDANAEVIAVSAWDGSGIEKLLAAMDREMQMDPVEWMRLRIPASEGGPLHLVHERTKVLSKQEVDEWVEFEVEVPASVRGRLVQFELIS